MVVGALAVAAALWLRGGAEDEEPTEELGTSAETAPNEPEPFDEAEPAPAARPKAAPAPVAQPTPQPTRPVKPEGPEPFDPQTREHAILMMTPLAKEAMDQGQLEQLKVIQQQVRERPSEGLMQPNDVEALNIAVGCLENGPDAREDATDFIEFGTPNSFGESLKKACFGGGGSGEAQAK
ncbi:MAG: hypothetical protein ABW252_13155 [Polyangiales bacterium]